MFHNHIELGRSVIEIAKENNVSDDTIRYHLKKNNIEIQKINTHKFRTQEEIDEIIHLYCNELLSANQIAKKFNTSHTVIIRLLQKQGIDTRNYSEAQFAIDKKIMPESYYDAEYLRKLHWDNNMTCRDIGKMFNVDAKAVRRHMQILGIPTKTNSESKIGLMTGDKRPNWQGGISELYSLLREFFCTNLAPKAAKRDYYTCQLCGATHTILHVHHIQPFNKIVKEICNEHKELNINDVDDKQKIYEIIVQDSRFLDLNNLITLCKECHFYRVHEYNKKTISSQAS